MSSSNFYNIALDCIDKNAQALERKHKNALLSITQDPITQNYNITRLSYSAMQGLSNRMANAFSELGLKKGERIIIRMGNEPEFLIVFLGAIKAQLIPIPTSPLFQAAELSHILRDSAASTLVCDSEYYLEQCSTQHFPHLKNIIVKHDRNENKDYGGYRFQELLKKSSPHFSTELTQARTPAYWLYTSGTSGRAKAAIHAHSSIRAHDARAQLWQDIQEGDIVFNTSALNWSYALTAGVLDIWRHGQTALIYQGSLQAPKLLDIIRRFKVTTFMSVPGIYRRIVDFLTQQQKIDPSFNPEVSFNSVRVCTSAGEKLPSEISHSFHALTGKKIYQGLGMTEHSVYIVQKFGEDIISGTSGTLTDPEHVRILDENNFQPCPPHRPGILATHKDCEGLFLGYHNLTASEASSCFQGEWFLSGDLAQADEKGNISFLGRKDDLLTAGGYRIAPLEIEHVLQEHPAVLEAAVRSVEIATGKNILEAFVVILPKEQESEELSQSILEYCEKQLAHYKIPRRIHFRPSLPRTARSKLDRQALAQIKL